MIQIKRMIQIPVFDLNIEPIPIMQKITDYSIGQTITYTNNDAYY